jgi:hypothetical protein
MIKSLISASICASVFAAYKPADPYYLKCMPFPKTRHESLESVAEDFKWDASQYMDFEAPKFIHTLDFDKVDYDAFVEDDDALLGYTAPFKVVNSAGVQKLREIIDNHKHRSSGNSRQQNIIRGIGYHSKFIEDFVHDETLMDMISEIAGERLCPATFGANMV